MQARCISITPSTEGRYLPSTVAAAFGGTHGTGRELREGRTVPGSWQTGRPTKVRDRRRYHVPPAAVPQCRHIPRQLLLAGAPHLLPLPQPPGEHWPTLVVCDHFSNSGSSGDPQVIPLPEVPLSLSLSSRPTGLTLSSGAMPPESTSARSRVSHALLVSAVRSTIHSPANLTGTDIPPTTHHHLVASHHPASTQPRSSPP